MHPVFATSTTLSRSPSSPSRPGIGRAALPPAQRQFAKANGFYRETRRLSGAARSKGASRTFCSASRTTEPNRATCSGRAPARPAAGRHLSLRQCAARYTARGAGFCARRLSLHPLSQGRQARASAWCRPTASTRRDHPHGRGRDAGARSHQHAVQRHGPGRAGRGCAGAREPNSARASPASSATIC